VPLRTTGLLTGGIVALLLVGGGFVLLPQHAHPPVLLALPLGLALAYGVARLWSGAGVRQACVHGIPIAAGIAGIAFALHAVSLRLPNGSLQIPVPTAVATVVSAAFVGLFLFQVLLWRFRDLPLGRRLHVHALNGFYVGTYANRALSRLWPRSQIP
jgi:hypothetical protein